MSLSTEYWYRKDDTAHAASNSRTLTTEADIDEIVELIRIGWLTDVAVFSESTNQLVVGSLGNGHATVCFSGPNGTYLTRGDGPDIVSSFSKRTRSSGSATRMSNTSSS
jgi:hypothetical protein